LKTKKLSRLQAQTNWEIIDASTLPNGSGSIIFDGKEIRKRTFWVFEEAGTIIFTVENNNLQPGCRITITEFKNITAESNDTVLKKDFLDEVYIKYIQFNSI